MSYGICTPQKGKIYRLKTVGDRVWLFRSNIHNGDLFLTEHSGAWCINHMGDDYFKDYVSHNFGCHIGRNEDIRYLKEANENEVLMFKRRLGL